MKFRRAALGHLEAPEQLDQVVRLASVPAWLITGVLAAIVAACATWASVGTVDRTVAAPGLLTHPNGVSNLDATTTGQIVKLWLSSNDLAVAGRPLYSVRGATGAISTVVAPWDAYVVSFVVTEGQLVQPGTLVADLERVNSRHDDTLEAVVFAPAAYAPMLQPGVLASLEVANAPSAAYGSLLGTVSAVGAFPETADSLRAFLGQDANVQRFLTKGSVIRVTITLQTSPASPSGLMFSKSPPPFQIDSESAVRSTFTIAREHPISWLLAR